MEVRWAGILATDRGGGGGQYVIHEPMDNPEAGRRRQEEGVSFGRGRDIGGQPDERQRTASPRFFSMFSGVGGFEIGIKRAYDSNRNRRETEEPREDTGVSASNSLSERERELPTCVGFSEIDKHASAVLRYHYPNVKNYGDCKEIDWSEVPDFDLLVGGSPCQDFSIAGKRAGLVGARSGLAYEYIRALEEKHPAHFIWENVRGVLSSNRGWDFAAILNQMAEAGYSLQWQVLNAKHFGVPQNRERVFVLGTRSDLGSPREVFFEPGADGKNPETVAVKPEAPRPAGNYLPRERVLGTEGVARALATSENQSPYYAQNIHQDYRITDPEGTSPTLNANRGGGAAKHPYIPTDTAEHPTIDANYYKGQSNQRKMLGSESRIRRLMPIECERLMSWPDGWTKYGREFWAAKANDPRFPNGSHMDYETLQTYEVSDTQRYKMCGNGVVSEVVAAIITQLYDLPH